MAAPLLPEEIRRNDQTRGSFDINRCQRNFRADFDLNVGAPSIVSCQYLNCESLSFGELPPYDPIDWGGRLSRGEYDMVEKTIQEALYGYFQQPICVETCNCCCITTIPAVLEGCCCRDMVAAVHHISEQFHRRGIQMKWMTRLTVNCESVAFKLRVRIVPI